jgi:16S rRNA (guanine1516-N2)-methyltransferase
MTYYISCTDTTLLQKCEALMQPYGLVYSDTHFPRLDLNSNSNGLILLDKQSAISIDWNTQEWKQRAKGERGADPLVKLSLASQGASVLDLTAGWGRDAMVMAHAGAHVMMLEQHPYLAALLSQAHQHLADCSIQQRTLVKWIEAKDYLRALMPSELPDVIYFDPMHPARQKSALVKKNLQILQDLVQPNMDVTECIELALQSCKKRVIVKWPQKLKPLIAPNYSINGKTIRFDVYLPKT